MMWGHVPISLIYMWLSSFPNTTCWRDCLFPIVFSCLLCQRLIDHIGVWVYFWALYSVLLIYMSFFVPVSCCFDYCSFVYCLKSGEGYTSCFVLFPQDLAILGLLWFHANYRIIYSSSVKYVRGIGRNWIKSLVDLASVAILTMFILLIMSMWCLSISLNHLWFLLLMFYSSQRISLLPPWSGLFLFGFFFFFFLDADSKGDFFFTFLFWYFIVKV